jgi:hypothetical protein
MNGHTEIASLLIGNGADINSKGDVSILVYICNYMIYHQYSSNHYQISLLVYDGIVWMDTIT